MKQTEVLVIGAGPSGSIAAAQLIKEGIQVTVIEKTKFPRFVIGESLLPRCMDILESVDLIESIKNKGFQEKFGAKFIMGDDSCDFNFSEQYTKGWDWTWQVPRADFDKALIDEVEGRGAEVLYESTVENVEFLEDEVITTFSHEGKSEQISSKYVIDGSGYGRVLPRLLDLEEASDMPARSAFFTHIKDENRGDGADQNRIQVLVIEPETWFWMIPFSNGVTSVGFVGDLPEVDVENPREFFQNMLEEHEYLKDRFGKCDFVFDPKLITAYSISVSRFYGDRYVLTGNSTEFLDPVFSSGVTFALESALKAAELVAKELRGEEANWETDYVNYIQTGVDVFRSYVNNWYDGTLHSIFFAKDIKQTIKEQICSVLAGYVWDKSNPYVKRHGSAPKTLAKVINYNF
ncbi:MAG: tryptophan 7-halogenase [Flavobacteriales bacterium]|jgi:flavin-dependent dehydrogenase|nr:tryptophan 7-halogenase [Flavobacteriales bacterium]